MDIEINSSSFGYLTAIFSDINVKIEQDVCQRSSGYRRRESSDEGIELFSKPLDDLMYYRENEYDSSDLIIRLFEKLPGEKQQQLLKQFIKDYGEE